MAWPFTNPSIPPNFDSTVKAVPAGGEVLAAGVIYLLGIRINNPGGVDRQVTVSDGAGNNILGPIDVPSKGSIPLDVPFEPLTGLQWIASGAGLIGHVWGYQ